MIHRVPSASLPTITAGMTSSVPSDGPEGQHPEGHGTAAGVPDLVVALHPGQHVRHGGQWHPRRHPPAGQADAVAHEQEAVAAGEAVEVDVPAERPGDRPHALMSASP